MMTEAKRDAREVPDPEVQGIRRNRQFSAEYKLEILERADACTRRGAIKELLEEEGLHSSYLSRWRRARAEGKLGGTQERKRGPKPEADEGLAEKYAVLERGNARLRARLSQVEMIVEAQKNSHSCLDWRP